MCLKKCDNKKTIYNNMLYSINFFLEKFLCLRQIEKKFRKKPYFKES